MPQQYEVGRDSPESRAEVLNRQGLSLAEQGRTAEAAAVFSQAVAVSPDHAAARHNLGVALANLGRPEEGAKSPIPICFPFL